MEIYPAPSRFSIKVFLMATSQRNSLQSYSNSNPVYLKFISAWNQKAGMANWAQLGGLILRVITGCAHTSIMSWMRLFTGARVIGVYHALFLAHHCPGQTRWSGSVISALLYRYRENILIDT